MSNTLIFNSTKIRQDATTHFLELRREYEMLVMFQLSRPIIKNLKSGSFASPKKPFSSATSTKMELEAMSHATVSTKASFMDSDGEDSLQEAQDLSDDTNAQYAGIIQEKVNQNDKKVKKILESLTKFEE